MADTGSVCGFIYKEFISNTVIDNVGVTKDKHAYLGIMKTMQV